MYPLAHIELARTPGQVRKYVTKVETRVEGPWEFGIATKKMVEKAPLKNKLKDLLALNLDERTE